ncbi:redoxin domain-containing protein [Maribellus comscasis]|uniref:Redoxin domain-containing protein n=1 Tax=Maribellus comscasis TaxID=2681766 RepID=A0A6I6JRX7_9BACT|nr:redoxin domain-containing protein [Maribellus comscasis]QGY42912.1 redoxin domain-containing protein [Maribellus comscasis]
MLKYILPILFFITSVSFAQEHHIEVQINSAPNKKLSLAYYYLGNIYIKDTVDLDERGFGTFEGDTILPQGLYKMYLDEKNHFDFLLGADQTFSIKSDNFSGENININGAIESEEFAKYVEFLKNLQEKSAQLKQEFQQASGEEKEKIQQELNELTPQLHNYWKNIKKKYPNSFVSAFLIANLVPVLDISTLPENVQNNDSLLLAARFNYQKEHYWDNFDYTDERLLYTPLYKPKLENWFTKVLYQNYDSVKIPVIEFIEEIRPHKRIFQYVTSYFLNSSINSNIMGMDALFVDIARRYYLSGEAFWASDETIEKVKENVMFSEHNLIGMTAPDLTLESVDGDFYNLHGISAKYTVIIIFEPNCSHCKVFVPEFHKEVYLPFRDEGLEVYSIYSMDDKNEWTEFLTKHDLYDWINVWDEHNVSRFKVLYDARKTPGVYVLDRDKKIVAKKLSVEQLKKFMEDNL